ncbi:MAG TPA: type IV pilus twitching motility protein PilT, partial [Gemmatimonadales bacterium]
MPPRIDPFVDVLLREQGDQLYLLPEEPVTMVREGKSRKVSKQPLTDQHIYALLVEVAPTESADHIDHMTETFFEYEAARGWVKVRVVPDGGRLTAIISRLDRAPGGTDGVDGGDGGSGVAPAPTAPAQRAPAAPFVAPKAPRSAALEQRAAAPPAPRSGEFTDERYKAAEQRLGQLLRALVESKSSDLHLRVGEPPIFRTHGELKRQGGEALTHEALDLMLLSIMPDRNRGEWQETGDSDFAYEIQGLARFRVNAARDRKGSVGVFRVIPAQVVSAEDLGLSKEVQALCYLTKGLVLVTGPTGSGKSTTLCGLIDLVNRTRTDHIITIEDPIEFVHQNKKCLITQRQVGVHTGGFKSALRAALREDPDIILVGEMRDLETIELAITAAETGHLVFGTLHTSSAAKTVDRIINVFPTSQQEQIRAMLSESLKGVLAQQLVPTVDGRRAAALEILLVNVAVSNLIREGKTFQIPSVIQTGRGDGMQLMDQALQELLKGGRISSEAAFRFALNKSLFPQPQKGG